MGVRVDGADKITYNHFDSYPDGLGWAIVNDVRSLLKDPGIDGLRQLARELRLVDGNTKATPKDIEKLKRYLDKGVSTQKADEWYCLMRGLQGKLAETLRAGVMIDDHRFMANSLFCEYAYVVNLDEEAFEVYRGFQREPHKNGRYSELERDPEQHPGYWPVALVKAFPIAAIPDNWDGQAFPPEEDECPPLPATAAR